jgi:hypothetical protein
MRQAVLVEEQHVPAFRLPCQQDAFVLRRGDTFVRLHALQGQRRICFAQTRLVQMRGSVVDDNDRLYRAAQR